MYFQGVKKDAWLMKFAVSCYCIISLKSLVAYTPPMLQVSVLW
jgi:hypothetical protein